MSTMKEIENLKSHHDQMMKKYGWVYHIVPGEGSHTHGVENFNHANFECSLELPQKVIGGIYHNLFNRIKTGDEFLINVKYEKILENFKVIFIEKENRLRLILPDPAGNLDRTKMQKSFQKQYEV